MLILLEVSIFNLFQYFVSVEVYQENPASHRYGGKMWRKRNEYFHSLFRSLLLFFSYVILHGTQQIGISQVLAAM